MYVQHPPYICRIHMLNIPPVMQRSLLCRFENISSEPKLSLADLRRSRGGITVKECKVRETSPFDMTAGAPYCITSVSQATIAIQAQLDRINAGKKILIACTVSSI